MELSAKSEANMHPDMAELQEVHMAYNKLKVPRQERDLLVRKSLEYNW